MRFRSSAGAAASEMLSTARTDVVRADDRLDVAGGLRCSVAAPSDTLVVAADVVNGSSRIATVERLRGRPRASR